MNNEPVAWLINGKLFEEYFRTSELDKIIPLYTHPANLTDEEIKEALACLEMAHDETMDYIKINNLGGENNHWLVWARAILRKAQEKC